MKKHLLLPLPIVAVPPKKILKTAPLALPYYEADVQGGGAAYHTDLSQHDGTRYTLNKGGKKFCGGYQDGTCCDSTGDNFCWYDHALAHQCSLCLKTGHGESTCRLRKGKGGGGGKAKGKAAKGGGKGKVKGKGKKSGK